jgi:hypothetical protein
VMPPLRDTPATSPQQDPLDQVSRIVDLKIDKTACPLRHGSQLQNIGDCISVVAPNLPPVADAGDKDPSIPRLEVRPHETYGLKIQNSHFVIAPLSVFAFRSDC